MVLREAMVGGKTKPHARTGNTGAWAVAQDGMSALELPLDGRAVWQILRALGPTSPAATSLAVP